MKKNKYRLTFIEGFFINNWSDNYNEDEAFKKVCESFEGEKELEQCIDEGIDVSFCISFESTERDLKATVLQKIENFGRNVDVFSVVDENNNTILTEENIEEKQQFGIISIQLRYAIPKEEKDPIAFLENVELPSGYVENSYKFVDIEGV